MKKKKQKKINKILKKIIKIACIILDIVITIEHLCDIVNII